MSAYLMISLNTQVFLSLNPSENSNYQIFHQANDFSSHPQWNHQTGWKNVLNNFRLLIQPSILLWWVFPWLEIFPDSDLLRGFHRLINIMNQFQPLTLPG